MNDQEWERAVELLIPMTLEEKKRLKARYDANPNWILDMLQQVKQNEKKKP